MHGWYEFSPRQTDRPRVNSTAFKQTVQSAPVYKRLKGLFGVCLLLASLQAAGAQSLADGFFIDSAFSCQFPLLQAADLLTPAPGFRLGGGYTYKNWSFALEAGLHVFSGKKITVSNTSLDSFVLQVFAVPVNLAVSYDFVFFDRLYLSPKIGAGVLFTSSVHYKNIIDLLKGNKSMTADAGFYASLSFEIGFAPLKKALVIYAGASADFLPERTIGAILFPSVRAGVRVYPARLASYIAQNKKAKPQKAPAELPVPVPPEEPDFDFSIRR